MALGPGEEFHNHLSDSRVPCKELGTLIAKFSKTSEYEPRKEIALGKILLQLFRLSTAKDKVRSQEAPQV